MMLLRQAPLCSSPVPKLGNWKLSKTPPLCFGSVSCKQDVLFSPKLLAISHARPLNPWELHPPCVPLDLMSFEYVLDAHYSLSDCARKSGGKSEMDRCRKVGHALQSVWKLEFRHFPYFDTAKLSFMETPRTTKDSLPITVLVLLGVCVFVRGCA